MLTLPNFPKKLKEVRPDTVIAITEGDSRTYQNHSISGNTTYRMSHGWFVHLQNRMRQRFEWSFASNFAVNGSTSLSVRDRRTNVKAYLDANPGVRKCAFIWIGINDFVAGWSTALSMGYMQTTIEYYLKECQMEHVFIIGEPPMPYAYSGQTAAQWQARDKLIRDYNTAMELYCRYLPDVTFIPIYDFFCAATRPVVSDKYSASALNNGEGESIHPSPVGAFNVAALVEPYVRQFYGDGAIDSTKLDAFINPVLVGGGGSNGSGQTLTLLNGALLPAPFYLSGCGTQGLTIDRDPNDGGIIYNIPPQSNAVSFAMFHSAGTTGYAIGTRLRSYIDYTIMERGDQLTAIKGHALRSNNGGGHAGTLEQNASSPCPLPAKGLLMGDDFVVGATDDIFQQYQTILLAANNNGLKIKIHQLGTKINY